MKKLAILAILALAACGVDGPPERPSEPKSNVSVSGEAVIGVSTEL